MDGLLESAYHECLLHELRLRKLVYETESASRRGIQAIERVEPIHRAQLLTYLRLVRRKLGLLINFHVPVLKEGVHRVVNNP